MPCLFYWALIPKGRPVEMLDGHSAVERVLCKNVVENVHFGGAWFRHAEPH